MRRFLSVFLVVVITICLLPVQAAEGTAFSDVSPDDWFAPYVEVCVEAGLMEGTGEGKFEPDRELTLAECRVLAYRLYDQRQGGDGKIIAAPEDWGQLTLTVDGRTFSGYTDPNIDGGSLWGIRGRGDWSADGADYPGYGLPAVFLGQEWRDWSWSVKELPAIMTMNGVEYPGKASYGRVNDSTVQISFLLDGGEAVAKALTDIIYDSPPAPGRWWRDLAYTLERQSLKRLFLVHDYTYYAWEGPASRLDFAQMLCRTTGELEEVNNISSIPDCKDEEVLQLYRAGILTGVNDYGVFNGEQGLTRAEAATILARVVEPTLRLSFSPTPLPTDYSLTYLMDGEPDCGICFPVFFLGKQDIMLTLDGQQLPWPIEEGSNVPSWGVGTQGDYCYLAYYDLSTKDPYDTKSGLIDRTGAWVVPPENGRTMETYAVEGGFFTRTHRDNVEVWGLLDEQGQWVRELEKTGEDPWALYPPKERTPLKGIEPAPNEKYYVDTTGTPVSQEFDWVSPITDDGQGFVGIDGKIYRIQFAVSEEDR